MPKHNSCTTVLELILCLTCALWMSLPILYTTSSLLLAASQDTGDLKTLAEGLIE
jgi:hypothetical protein